MIKLVKSQMTKLVIPDLGHHEDWIIVGIGDASNRSNNDIFAVSGYVILIVNKKTNASTVIDWPRKKSKEWSIQA